MNKKYLIDTHILIWALTEPSKLTQITKNIIEQNENEIFVSIISFWEIAIKRSLGKLKLGVSLQEFYDATLNANISILQIEFQNILILDTLPFHHDDPFDRIIISQSITENLPIITKDKKFKFYDIDIVWKNKIKKN